MRILYLLVILLIINLKYASSAEIIVYGAAGISNVIDELIDDYKKINPQDRVKVIYGSSGKGFSKVINGAPYDIFLSADMNYVEELYKRGFTINEPKTYAIGRIVLFKLKNNNINIKNGISSLLNSNLKKIVIVNWEFAPYGFAAKECMIKYNIFDTIRKNLVLAETVSQAAHYLVSGSADVGILSYSIALNKTLKDKGEFTLIPEDCHSKIKHGYAILKNATTDEKKLEIATKFYNYISSKKAADILYKFGLIPTLY